jgi:predicted ATP-grasp superfamily ATP-dependent carboligase
MTDLQARAYAASSVRHGERAAVAGALIVGGAHVSIAVARSLGRHGIPVWLLANHPLARFSRYIQRRFDWPGAEHPDGVASILDVAAENGLKGWVLIATGDPEMRMLAQNHALLSAHFRVATPDWDTIRWAYDKRLTYQRAALLRIDFPWSFQPRDLEELWRLECRFPVVLKPAFRKGEDAFTRAKAWKAETRAELLVLYQRAVALAGNDAIIVQEWIPGTGSAQFSYAGLFERGEPIASLVARRTRQYPIDFGRSSTFVETIEQPRVEELGRRFLKSIDYTGVAEVEFKYDERDGHYKLLDVNGRFWTWCGVGARAGVDFPYLAWRQAIGDRLPQSRGRPGVGWMLASRDLMAAWQQIMRGTLNLRDYLSSFRQPMTFASFAFDDPLPALLELPVVAWHRIGGALRAARQTDPRKGLRRRLAGIAKFATRPRRIANWRRSQPRAASASAPNTAKTKGLRSRL